METPNPQSSEEQEFTEWQAICKTLNLREETVEGTDEQGMVRNHYLKWFTPNPQSSEEEKIVKEFRRFNGADAVNEEWLRRTLTQITLSYDARMRELINEYDLEVSPLLDMRVYPHLDRIKKAITQRYLPNSDTL